MASPGWNGFSVVSFGIAAHTGRAEALASCGDGGFELKLYDFTLARITKPTSPKAGNAKIRAGREKKCKVLHMKENGIFHGLSINKYSIVLPCTVQPRLPPHPLPPT